MNFKQARQPKRRGPKTNEDESKHVPREVAQSFEYRRAHAPLGHGDALQVDFNKSLQAGETPIEGEGSSISLNASCGRYKQARKQLRRAQVAHLQNLALIDDEHAQHKAAERIFEERVKLSATTGVPTLRNKAERQLERSRAALERQKRGEPKPPPLTPQESAVEKSYARGELVCSASGLSTMPTTLCNTLSMQLGITRISMRKNNLSELLNTKECPHLHVRNYLHVTEMDLQHNKIKALPEDFGLLSRLKRINLKFNHLSSLPGSFVWLERLELLDLTSNLFRTLTDHIGKLRAIETLLMPQNALIEIPTTLPQLKKLKRLDLSGNGLCHLAIKPLVTAESEGVTEAWEEVIDPMSKKKYYYNSVTGLSRSSMPDSLKQSRLDASAGVLRPGTKEYNDQKRVLSGQGVPEWEAMVDPKNGTIYYRNNVSETSSWDMPEVMDTFGNFPHLTHLTLNDNSLRALPESCSRLTTLQVLEAKNNFLSKLPAKIGNMKSLRQLKVNNNELSVLPQSMSELVSLKELNLASNHLTSLSPWIGDLPVLEQLFLGNNSLESLPSKLGYCKTLTELQVYNNPITYPPYELISQGMEKMMHALRANYLEATQGPPPVMKPHFFGTMDENVELAPEFKQRIDKAIEKARETNELLLFLAGLHEMPPQLAELEDLQVLRFQGNHLADNPPAFPESLTTSLTFLSLKACEIVDVDDSLCTLSCLKHLDLEDNQLTKLPSNFARLRKLEVLHLEKNRLFMLPDDLGTMTALKELYADMNRLDLLPDSLPQLRHLQVLHLNKNSLYTLPDLSKLVKLEVLSLEANQIHRLPAGIGNLKLTQLKVAHNRLERLDADILTPHLRSTIEVLRVSNNNLQELPALFNGVEKLRELSIEYNPMRSPPAEMLPEPLEVVVQYCNVRAARVTEVKELLDEFEFESDPSHFTPDCRDALTGNTGYLTPDDLANFDVGLDAYINGSFYKCPVSAVDMVEKVDRLREERKFVFYNMLLAELILVLEEELGKKGKQQQFSRNVLCDGATMPWGRNGEEVNCYVISMDALLVDTEPNKYVRKFRPCLWELVKENLPVTIFEYEEQMLKDAIEEFESVWEKNRFRNHPVALIDKYEFARDEVFLDNGKERRLVPCEIPALYIVKVIYTSQEKRRRAEEDEMFWNTFRKTEESVITWVESKSGKALVLVEIKARIKRLNKDLQATSKIRDQLSKQVDAAKDMVEAVAVRKADYDAGKPVHIHKIHSMEEAVELVTNADDALLTAQKAVENVDEEMRVIRAKIQMNRRLRVMWITMDLQRKYCHQAWKKTLQDQRLRARRRGWRRPWDGEDGVAFAEWQEVQAVLEAKVGEEQPEEEPEESDSDSDSEGKKQAKQPYDFNDLVDMEQYDSEAYHRFLTQFRPDGLVMPWIRALEGGEEGEEGDAADLDA